MEREIESRSSVVSSVFSSGSESLTSKRQDMYKQPGFVTDLVTCLCVWELETGLYDRGVYMCGEGYVFVCQYTCVLGW